MWGNWKHLTHRHKVAAVIVAADNRCFVSPSLFYSLKLVFARCNSKHSSSASASASPHSQYSMSAWFRCLLHRFIQFGEICVSKTAVVRNCMSPHAIQLNQIRRIILSSPFSISNWSHSHSATARARIHTPQIVCTKYIFMLNMSQHVRNEICGTQACVRTQRASGYFARVEFFSIFLFTSPSPPSSRVRTKICVSLRRNALKERFTCHLLYVNKT